MSNQTQTFTLDGVAWQIQVDGKVYPDTYNSKGAAIAGIVVQQRRNLRRQRKQNLVNKSITTERDVDKIDD